jgi:hypothetical protein
MEWLHGRAILGNLFVEGSTVEGDLLALSFVEGVVSAPSRTPSPPYDLLVRYAAARNHAATVALLDEIESFTSDE